jgi:hypothetical protein
LKRHGLMETFDGVESAEMIAQEVGLEEMEDEDDDAGEEEDMSEDEHDEGEAAHEEGAAQKVSVSLTPGAWSARKRRVKFKDARKEL